LAVLRADVFQDLSRGVCFQFVNNRLAPASYVFFFVLAFGSRGGQDVLMYGCMCIDILMLVYCLYNLIFSVKITEGLDN
jgi:hypothetical protein